MFSGFYENSIPGTKQRIQQSSYNYDHNGRFKEAAIIVRCSVSQKLLVIMDMIAH